MILGTQQNWFHHFWIHIQLYIDFTIETRNRFLKSILEMKKDRRPLTGPVAHRRARGLQPGVA